MILEYLLFTIYRRKDTSDLSRLILMKFGSLSNVFKATKEELMRGYDEAYAELKEWQSELEQAIARDFGSPMRDYLGERKRLERFWIHPPNRRSP